MAATATAALDSILALRAQLLVEIDSALDDPSQANHISALDKQLHDIDMAIGQVRIYLLGFHRTLASAQALAQGNIEITQQIAVQEKTWLVAVTKLK